MNHMLTGLSETEALKRRTQGQGNQMNFNPSRSYWQILSSNLFTFVNLVLFLIGGLLVVLGSPADAVTTAGLVSLNVIVGVFQEARAKRKLDQIALLSRPKVRVIRDSQEKQIDPSEIVLGDLLHLQAGDQIMSDGLLRGDGKIEVDESLLTGESDYIPKSSGDPVFAGSFCITGQAYYETTQVGAESLANKITAKARQFKQTKTPLQKDVDLIVRLVGLVSAVLGGLLYIAMLRGGASTLERVQMAAVAMGMIPQGLIFLVTLTYGLGVIRIAGKGALIQQMNALESMSNVTTLCLDKTGTLTTNQIKLYDRYALKSDSELTQQLALFANTVSSPNRTTEALQKAFPHERGTSPGDEVPFASSRKWSGLVLDDGAYILGAPEVLQSHLSSFTEDIAQQIEAWSAKGLRVVLFAFAAQITRLHNAEEKPTLPANLTPLGLLALSDELRPEAHATLKAFAQAGIKLKIISGDNPQTVAALAQQAGFDTSGGVVSGLELAKMSEAEFAHCAQKSAVFGRITPDQKETLVQALQNAGEYVAMIGDGVNDVMSLKQAQVGIAMQSGSSAARNVADIILWNDSFAVLPSAFTEGQRIVNGLQDTMRLLLSRTFYVAFLIMAVAILGLEFPFLPRHDTLNSFLTAGLPPMLLAIWARSGQPSPARLKDVFRLVVPAALSVGLLSLGIFVYILDHSGQIELAQTGITLTVIGCGAGLIWFIKPPIPFFVVDDPLCHDWIPILTAPLVLILLALVLLAEPLRDFFALYPLQTQDYGIIGGGVLLWMLIYRQIRIWRLTERFFGL